MTVGFNALSFFTDVSEIPPLLMPCDLEMIMLSLSAKVTHW